MEVLLVWEAEPGGVVMKQRLVHFPYISSHPLLPQWAEKSQTQHGVMFRLTGSCKNKQTNKQRIWMYTVASWKLRTYLFHRDVTSREQNLPSICGRCVRRKWNEWTARQRAWYSAYANEDCDWLSLSCCHRLLLAFTDQVSVGVFLVQGLLMVCNHLTINLTSELQQLRETDVEGLQPDEES